VFGNCRPDRHQRLRRATLVQLSARRLERVHEVIVAAHRDAEKRIAERRRTNAAGTIDGADIGGGRCDDDGLVVLQCVDPRAGLARGYDDNAPPNAGGVEELPQALRRQ
jgi:hypothetical protein